MYLLHQRAQVVTKDELLDKVWPGTVVSEAALTRCIARAREAVGDDGEQQRIIKTQHGRGYRFVAPLTLAPPVVSSQQSVASSQEETGDVRLETGSLPFPVSSLQSPVPSSPPQDSALNTCLQRPGAPDPARA